MNNILEQLIIYADTNPFKKALSFIDNEANETDSINYSQLVSKAQAVAAFLQSNSSGTDRVALLFPAGIHFTVGFLGCLFSGNIAVPIHNLEKFNLKKILGLILSILQDSKAELLLTNSATVKLLSQQPEFNAIQNKIAIIEISSITDSEALYQPISVSKEDITHLQYTSGSTSASKGVITTFDNITASLSSTAKAWNYSNNSITLNWAPHTHVYGLICGLLLPLYTGSTAIIMSPSTFLLNPYLWLKAITLYQATHAGCPNFGYDLCTAQIDSCEMKGLDLSSWVVAVNGGEAVQATTLINFYEKFKFSGFKFSSFCPSYGMSECTGLIACVDKEKEPTILSLDSRSLQSNKVIDTDQNMRQVVSCGKSIEGLIAKIVNPESFTVCPDNTVGEVWLSGPSCSKGYWQKQEKTLFSLHGDSFNHYIRTGDLGFIRNDQIYIVSRLKELIIINGKNYHPLDIERTVQRSHQLLGSHPGIAFGSNLVGTEELFIIQGINPMDSPIPFSDIIDNIRKAISQEHGLDVSGIIFTKDEAISKTSSGKVQRLLTKSDYFNNKLEIIFQDLKKLPETI